MEPDVGIILTVVFIGVAVILFIIPTLMISSRKKKLRRYLYETEAEVISMDRRRFTVGKPDPGNPPLWVPTFRYYAGGQEFIRQSHVGTTKKLYEVGDRLAVKVDPYDPQKYVLVENKPFYLAVGILYSISGAFIVFSGVALLIIRRLG